MRSTGPRQRTAHGRGGAHGRRRAARAARAAAVALALTVVALLALDRLFPPPLPAPGMDAATVVLARDGTPLRAFAGRNGVWRYPVQPEEVSPLYLQALLGYEDRWFHHHPGINPWALARAAWQWLRRGEIVSGGSTLTMQVARLIEPMPRTIPGKLRQLLRALQLETHLGKRDILGLYLDHAPFGGTISGVEAASWAWLGKSAAELSHAEAALLAVLPQAPSRLRPDRHPERARAARDKVLQRLAASGTWSAPIVAAARQEPVVARTLDVPLAAPLLAARLHAEAPGERSIRSTIDANLQAALEARVATWVGRLPPHTSAAVLVLENDTGAARAYVGTAAFGDATRLGYVDMVRAWRSPGSALKPFLYALALEDGLIHTQSLLMDAPQSFGGYRPGDFGVDFSGPVAAGAALRESLNLPAVELLQRYGPARFAARLEHAGVPLRLPPLARPNLAIILGGAGVRLEDLVSGYTALGNDGIATAARLRADAPRRQRRLLAPGSAWIVRQILSGHAAPGQAPDPRAGTRPQLAWKTGTSHGYRDSWALGSTPRYSLGVWIGRPDGTPLPGRYGAVTALPLLFQVADSLPRTARRSGARPASVGSAEICWPLGTALDPRQPELCARRKRAWTLDGAVPPTLAPLDARQWSAAALRLRVTADGAARLSAGCHRAGERQQTIARWPTLAWPWLEPGERRRARLPPLASGCAADGLDRGRNLRLDGVVDGSVVRRAPNSSAPPRLALRLLGSEEPAHWLVDDQLAATTLPGEAFVHDYTRGGERRVTALTASGDWASARFRVQP